MSGARVVTYAGVELHLTAAEYEALRLASFDDPIEAERMAREFLRREEPPSEAQT